MFERLNDRIEGDSRTPAMSSKEANIKTDLSYTDFNNGGYR